MLRRSVRQIQVVALTIAFAFAFSAAPVWAQNIESVTVGYGTLQLSGLFQAGVNYNLGDDELAREDVDLDGDGEIAEDGSESDIRVLNDRPVESEFVMRRVRVALKGDVMDEKVGYLFQAEFSEPEDGVRLLDARMDFAFIPYTTVNFGRFLPNFTYWQPMNKALTYTILLPQMNEFLGVQRQTGVNVNVYHRFFELDFGAFNGRQEINAPFTPEGGMTVGENDADTWDDENSAKDLYVSGAIKPVPGLKLFGGYWYGRPLDYYDEDGDGELTAHDVDVGIVDAGLAYLSDFGLSIWGEFMRQTVKFDGESPAGSKRADDFTEYVALSWYAMLAFNLNEAAGVPLEVVGRYDYLDPDSENDRDTHGYHDETQHVTAGLNYYIQSNHAMMSANIILKDDDIEALNKARDDSVKGVDDDVFLFQVQVWF
ncbi:MAG: hypothetical protein H6683_00245 [Deltaproteobacteria bacterium]|nr:hypothetical protein [Deltaproteobacteria bacterium]